MPSAHSLNPTNPRNRTHSSSIQKEVQRPLALLLAADLTLGYFPPPKSAPIVTLQALGEPPERLGATRLCLSAKSLPPTSKVLTPRTHTVCSQGTPQVSSVTISVPVPCTECLLQFLNTGFASINSMNLYIKTHTRTHYSRTSKNPTRPRVGAGNRCHRLTGSPTPGTQPENPGQYMLQASPDIRTLVRVPTFGSWSPNVSLRANAADNFSEINKPVWIKQEATCILHPKLKMKLPDYPFLALLHLSLPSSRSLKFRKPDSFFPVQSNSLFVHGHYHDLGPFGPA